MQKDLRTITVEYPWKPSAEGGAIYNDSAEFRGSESPKSGLQEPSHLDVSRTLGHQSSAGSPANLHALRAEYPYDGTRVGSDPSEIQSTTEQDPGRISEISPSLESISTPPHKAVDGGSGPSFDSSARAVNRLKAVSGTKRAAQNRSAQKAFRERREKYVKELEATAHQVVELQKTVEQLRQENAELRGYTLALQNRLMELNPGDAAHLP